MLKILIIIVGQCYLYDGRSKFRALYHTVLDNISQTDFRNYFFKYSSSIERKCKGIIFLQFGMEKTFLLKKNDPTAKKDCRVDYFNIVHFCLKVAIKNVKKHVTDWNMILAT